MWAQIQIIDYPVKETRDWAGISTTKCPCYIYAKSKSTNADLLSKFYMIPPGYKSLQDRYLSQNYSLLFLSLVGMA